MRGSFDPSGRWRRWLPGRELWLNLAVIVVVPLVARVVGGTLAGPVTAVGLGRPWTLLTGGNGLSDIGGEVTAAYGLISRDHTPYDPTIVLDVIHQGTYGLGAQTHPPTSIPIWAPFLLFDYRWWLPFFMVASACAIAGTMRLMRVPASVAYPVALGICLTAPGAESLVTSYPLSALALAAAWRYRDRPVAGGLALGMFAAERGVGAVLLLYPAVRRRWRLVAVAVGVLVGLTLLAVVLEPTVIEAFWTKGRDAVAENLARSDLYTPYAVLERRGLPVWLLGLAVLGWSAVAWRRGSDLFWVLVWATAAVSPLAWHYSSIMLIPLGVATWFAGSGGRAVTIVTGFLVFATMPLSQVAAGLGWLAALGGLGLGIVLAPVGRDLPDPRGRSTALRFGSWE